MAITPEVSEAVALHYERRAARADAIGRGAVATMHRLWAAKARAGRVNQLVMRAQRIADARCIAAMLDNFNYVGSHHHY